MATAAAPPRPSKRYGQKRGARKAFARTIRQRAAAHAYGVEGKPQDQIARELGVNQTTVSRDLRAVQAELVRDSVADLARWRDEQLARLERLREELMAEWQRSKGEMVISRQEMALQDDGKPKAGSKRASVMRHERVGDSKLMGQVLAIEDMIAKLRGTYAGAQQGGEGGGERPNMPRRPDVLVIRVG